LHVGGDEPVANILTHEINIFAYEINNPLEAITNPLYLLATSSISPK
jgi:hypothetical protein